MPSRQSSLHSTCERLHSMEQHPKVGRQSDFTGLPAPACGWRLDRGSACTRILHLQLAVTTSNSSNRQTCVHRTSDNKRTPTMLASAWRVLYTTLLSRKRPSRGQSQWQRVSRPTTRQSGISTEDSTKQALAFDNEDEHLFKHTWGRFVVNEP